VGDGKRAATALTNAVLTQLHLPALPLGPLGEVPGLRPAATAKLLAQQEAALAELADCLGRLQAAAEGLSGAAAGLEELLAREAEAPVLGEGPVFAALPLRLLGGMLGEVATQHGAELTVKAGVLQGFRQIAGERADGSGCTTGECGFCSQPGAL